ncbi:nucleoside hydrolase [Novosphingobium gossypii]|uniref:nucleoside hydrolase n=1 Tax=Novosphingobium gossypii TaxID=1604774 RepID=UPI003D2204A1
MPSVNAVIRAVASLLTAAAVLLALPAQAEPVTRPAPQKIIIDDEGFSLMHVMLLNSPQVDVVGVTSVTGNWWAPRGAAMQLRGLEIMGRTDVPVAQGAINPLLNTEKATERWEALYGKLTWKGVWMKQWAEPTQQSTPPYYGPDDLTNLPWGAPTTKASAQMAAVFMIEMVRKYPGQIIIVAGGPMTNLALAQRLDPEFAKLARGLIYMGGSFNPHRVLDDRSAVEFAREFANSPRREFNIRLDPEAASIVSRAPWKQITVIPVDPSTSTQLSRKLLGRAAKAAGPQLGKHISSFEAGFPLWDEIVAAVLLDPSVVTSAEDLYVDYDTQFGATYGDTLSWREHYQPGLGEQKAHVVLSIDPRKLDDVIVRAVTAR